VPTVGKSSISTTWLYVVDYDGPGSDAGVLTYMNWAKHDGSGPKLDTIPDYG